MPATSVGAPLINAAAAREGVKEAAVAACPARQGKQTVFEVEMLDQARLGQASGDLLGCFVLGLERFTSSRRTRSASPTSTGIVQQLAEQ